MNATCSAHAETLDPCTASERDFTAQCLPHQRELLATARRMTRSDDDARDLVQETMLRAFVAWSRFQHGEDANCRAWLFRILTNSYINLYRRRQRYSHVTRDCLDDTLAALHGDLQSRMPEDALIEDALGDEVSAALAGLGDEHRQVVELADLHGVAYRDIAARLGVPVGTVMSRLFRARRKLEAELGTFAATDYGIGRARSGHHGAVARTGDAEPAQKRRSLERGLRMRSPGGKASSVAMPRASV